MVKHCVEAYTITPEFSLFAMDCIKPLDNEKLKELFGKYNKIVIVEDNFNSGLFNSLCQWVVESRMSNCRLYSISPKEGYEERIGDSQYLEDKNELTPKKIAARIGVIRRKEDRNT
jgi:deoxyxylulose-5-phosphate synthase